jgi:FMN-dependent NADH-azoreductase
MKILYINACIRQGSRTKRLADYLVKKIGGDVKEIVLSEEKTEPFDDNLLQKRDRFISENNFNDEMFSYAKDFAETEAIVVAAPYWDLSFPSVLKVYFEHINVLKLVFDYSDTGEIVSLCKAKKLYYVTTKGGYGPDDFGFKYIEALSKTFYGIKDVVLIKAEGLDVYGNNIEDILSKTKKDIDKLVSFLKDYS